MDLEKSSADNLYVVNQLTSLKNLLYGKFMQHSDSWILSLLLKREITCTLEPKTEIILLQKVETPLALFTLRNDNIEITFSHFL